MSNNKHTIVALMQDRPGVLNRAVSLFRRRGFNIESLAVGHSETPGVSRMTLVVEAADVEQVTKQLYRLIEVLKVSDVTNDPTVEREMALVKIHAPSQSRPEVVALCSVFDAKIVDVGYNTMIIEMTGTPSKVENFVEVIRPFGVAAGMPVPNPSVHQAIGLKTLPIVLCPQNRCARTIQFSHGS